MKQFTVVIPYDIYQLLWEHLFEGTKEQGAFLFAQKSNSSKEQTLVAKEAYLIPPEGWDVQEEYYLELKDSEKIKIMKLARERDSHLIEIHSHRNSLEPVNFSTSDITGLRDFVAYVRWKLPGKIYVAMVWNRNSIKAAAWGSNGEDLNIKEIRIEKYRFFIKRIVPGIPHKKGVIERIFNLLR